MDVSTLEIWGRSIKKQWIADNALHLDLSRVVPENLENVHVPYRDISDFMDKLVVLNSSLQDQVNSLSSRVCRLENTLLNEIRLLQSSISSIASPAVQNNASIKDHRKRKRKENELLSMPAGTSMVSEESTDVVKLLQASNIKISSSNLPFPPKYSSLNGIEIKDVFHSWFADDLYVRRVRSDLNKQYSDIKQVVIYAFEEASDAQRQKLQSRPASKTSDLYPAWSTEIHVMADDIQTKLMDKFNGLRKQLESCQQGNPSVKRRKKREWKPVVSGVVSKIRKAVKKGLLPKLTNIPTIKVKDPTLQ